MDSNKSTVATTQEKNKDNKPSQQKPTNKAAVRSIKAKNITLQRDNLTDACRGSRVNYRGSEITVTITIALKLAGNKL